MVQLSTDMLSDINSTQYLHLLRTPKIKEQLKKKMWIKYNRY